MLEMVRQQMIFIIAPAWPGAADLIRSKHVSEALTNLFSDVGVVHFASIALLPAMTNPKGGLPSLMLELVVEEGLYPYDLLVRLVYHPSDALWSLYRGYWSEQCPLASQRKQELLVRLMSWHHIADGAFVGARDRTVQQIKMERGLLKQTRAAARELKAKHGHDRASFALALSGWAYEDARFEWAAEPAPRSFWRGKGARSSAKLAYSSVIVGLGLAFVWLVGALSRLLMHADSWLFERPGSTAQTVFYAVSEASRWFLGCSGRLLLALTVVAFFLWVFGKKVKVYPSIRREPLSFFIALPALFAPLRIWLESLRLELDRPTEARSSLCTYFGLWLVGAPFVLVGIGSIVVYTFCPNVVEGGVSDWMLADLGWKLLLVGAFAILVLPCAGKLSSWISRRHPKVSAWFYHPHEDHVYRAQQIHPSIEHSDARLVAGTAHMISLTDIRTPYGWSKWWIRVILRIVTLAGRVFFTEGLLGDAPGIHFGHWHIIDDGRRFLFCSNYDGSFGGYLDDFINGASVGTTLVWRWTELKRRTAATDGHPGVAEPRAFPPSRFLAFRGVKCESAFKSYARDSMLPHLYRFDAYNLSMDEIQRATVLRDALFGERDDSKDDQIMRAIES